MKQFKRGDIVKLKYIEFTGSAITFRVHSRDETGHMTLDPIDRNVQKKEGRFWQWFTDDELISPKQKQVHMTQNMRH